MAHQMKSRKLKMSLRQERDKISSWRLLNDEKPTRAMISLEKKLSGYTRISKINKKNPNYNENKNLF